MKQFLRQMFIENLGLKVVALALAFALLWYVQGERRRDAVTGAIVKLTLIPPHGKVLTIDPMVDKLTVTLRGPRSAVQEVMGEGLEPIEINLEGHPQGPLRFTSDLIRVPRALSVESIQPPQIDVTWEDRLMRSLRIVARFSGKPASGYRMSRVDVVPKEAEVSGPKSAVESLPEVETREIRLEGREHSFEAVVPLHVGRKFVNVRPETARVWVELTAETINRRFSGIPVRLLHTPDDLDVEVKPEVVYGVTLEGPAPILARLEPRELSAAIDVRDIHDMKAGGSYLRPAHIEPLPKGVRVLSTAPSNFAVTVRKKGRTNEKGQD
jgi:YbbR domain-containing protein